jgi:hypothetical protein
MSFRRAADPANVAVARSSVRLAFVSALQLLPARGRAALILREDVVLEIPPIPTWFRGRAAVGRVRRLPYSQRGYGTLTASTSTGRISGGEASMVSAAPMRAAAIWPFRCA